MNSYNARHLERELNLSELKFYWVTVFFIAANVVLPMLLHQFPMGGRMFLPIYFFTLIAGYRFGWKAGVMTAIASPIASFLLTGMPPFPVLSFVLVKGILLGVFSGAVARLSTLPVLLNLGLVVVLYQLVGSVFEWFMLHNMALVLSDITTGYIGLAIQIFGGGAVLNLMDSVWKKNH
jgi:hypothetical protein